MNPSAQAHPFAKFLVKTAYHEAYLNLRAAFERQSIVVAGSAYRDPACSRRTAYCISPYKTGTTYFAGLFCNEHRVRHEPMHYLTLRNLADTNFLSRRARFLSLELECSGFFAGHLANLRVFAPDAPVVYLKRSPEAWVESVINYFSNLAQKVSYNYVCRLLFDRVCHSHAVDRFFVSNECERSLIIRHLVEYWIKVYDEGLQDCNVLMIPLIEVDARVHEIEDFLTMRACIGKRVWKRENIDKVPIKLDDYIDLSLYKSRFAEHGY